MPDTLTSSVRPLLWVAVAISLAAQIGGLFLPLIEPDEALYATISRELSAGQGWASLTLHGEPWLDKPHFPFWCAALSMRVLGSTPWAYRLPGFLFYLMGVAYVYRSGRRFFAPGVAPWAVVVTLTAYHLVFSNHDVRAEAYLVGLVTAALYHLAAAGETKRLGHAVVAGFLVGLCVITKGPFLVFATAGAAVLASLFTRCWPRWSQVVLFVASLLVPIAVEMLALAAQHGDSALHAIAVLFWEGQSNRFLSSRPGLPGGGLFFYVHTLVWAFAPWFPTLAVFLVAGAFALKGSGRPASQGFGRVTFLLSAAVAFVLFSVTRSQLPYYYNFEMPVLALMVGSVIVQPIQDRSRRLAGVFQLVLTTALLLVVAAVLVFAMVPHRWEAVAVLALPFGVLVRRENDRPWVFSAAAGCAAALVMSFVFYPWLLGFEAGLVASERLPTHEEGRVHTMGFISYAFDFYGSSRVHILDPERVAQWQLPKDDYLYVWADQVPRLEHEGLQFEVVDRFRGTAVSQPRLPFLNPETRDASLWETVLLRTR